MIYLLVYVVANVEQRKEFKFEQLEEYITSRASGKPNHFQNSNLKFLV